MRFTKLRFIIFCISTIVLIVFFGRYFLNQYVYKSPLYLYKPTLVPNGLFLNNISQIRLNKLFEILQYKEIEYEETLDELGIVSFKHLKSNKNRFEQEINKYLQITNDNRVHVKQNFVDYLQNLSYYHSYVVDRTSKENDIKRVYSNNSSLYYFKGKTTFVILMASNSAYFKPLEAALYYVHVYFPNTHLIVYDLGLTIKQKAKLMRNCHCELRFMKKNLVEKFPHLKNLKEYAWKPVIIQEVLNDYDHVIYIDSSIRFKTNNIHQILETSKITGLITQYSGYQLICYTNPKMFEWFNGKINEYENYWTIEAFFIIMHKNFINSLIMKAWVTCALDGKNCIAPAGSRIRFCCGCHRYDQDALTIINTHFFAHPTNGVKPAYALKNFENIFDVKRKEGLNYFIL